MKSKSLVIATLLAIVISPGMARAGEPPTETPARVTPAPSADAAAEARRQYEIASQDYKLKCYFDAASHFEAAASLRTSAIALYTAGMAWDLAPNAARAADAYTRALEIGGLDAKQVAAAKERLAQLEPGLGTLLVTGPRGVDVHLDGGSEVAVPARLHGDPGARVLNAKRPGKPVERLEVVFEVGKTTTIELPEVEEPPVAKPVVAPEPVRPQPEPARPAPVETSWSTRRVTGVFLGGASVAAFGGAALLGVSANGAEDAYHADRSRSAQDHASSLQTWTNVSLVGGAVLLAAAVALVVWPEDGKAARARTEGALGGAGVGGSF